WTSRLYGWRAAVLNARNLIVTGPATGSLSSRNWSSPRAEAATSMPPSSILPMSRQFAMTSPRHGREGRPHRIEGAQPLYVGERSRRVADPILSTHCIAGAVKDRGAETASRSSQRREHAPGVGRRIVGLDSGDHAVIASPATDDDELIAQHARGHVLPRCRHRGERAPRMYAASAPGRSLRLQIRATLLSVVAMSVTGCAAVEKDRVVSEGVVLPNSMCAKH